MSSKESPKIRNIRTVAIAFGLALLCIIWVGLYYKVQSEKQLEINNVRKETGNLARAFEEHTLRTINNIEQTALFIKYQYEQEGRSLNIPRYMSEGRFARQPLVLLSVADETGELVVSSQVPFVSSNVKDREHFLAHKNIESKMLYIAKPVVGRASGKWIIPMSLRINKPDGSFGGVVIVSVDPFYFSEFYNEVDLGQNSVVALIGHDGVVRARKSGANTEIGQDLTRYVLAENLSTGVSGFSYVDSHIDGITRFRSYRNLRDYPLTVSVGVDEAVAMHDWNQRIVSYCIVAAQVSFMILLFIFLLLRLDARQKTAEAKLKQAHDNLELQVAERTEDILAANEELQAVNQNLEEEIADRRLAEKTLDESEARYRAVIKQAPEAVLLCDPDTGDILEANSRFTEQLGYDLSRDGAINLFELIIDDAETCRDALKKGSQTGIVPLQRRLFRHRNGHFLAVERAATLVHYRGRSLFVITLRNVSDEVRREQEIVRDAQMATRLQKALLPILRPSANLEIATIYQPLGYVGGDLYFLDWRYEDSLLRGFLVDATGHGLGTALHTASLHVLLREVYEQELPLDDAMRWLNRRAGDYFAEDTFAGALGFELDLQTRQLRWVCAGIPPIWVSTQAKQGRMECPGMFLGIRQEELFDLHTMPIDVGDSFYFMTDGLSDPLGLRTDLPLDRYPEMVGLLQALSESTELRDDATAVCIHVRSLPHSLVRQDGWPRVIRFNGYGDYSRFKGEVAKILAEVTGRPHSLHEVAVNEALANAMECRDGVPRQHKASIRFNKVGNRLIVRVKTSRMGFAGNAILRRLRSHPEEMFAFGEDAAMGRGIPMMLSMSHKMMYNSEGTEVLLAWKL